MQKTSLALALACALTFPAWACGPDFPGELLTDRTETLQGMVSGEFQFESTQLLAKVDPKWPAEFNQSDYWFEASAEQPVPAEREKIETEGYSVDQLNAWRAARNSESGAQALLAAAGLPPAHQHYLAGAVAFNAGALDEAKAEFALVEQLGDEGRSRIVWARFMLGRIAQSQGDFEAAKNYWEAARAAASDGAPDPLGLATASLGMQAKPAWDAVVQALELDGSAAASQAVYDNVVRAVTLYAQQAAQGSVSAGNSLLFVARKLNSDAALLDSSLREPVVRRLMSAYAFSRGFEALSDAQTDAYYAGDYANPDTAAGSGEVRIKPDLLEAMLRAQPKGSPLEGADRFAAALYRAGQFDRAAEFAKQQDTPLAQWVLAKVALRAGDAKAAATHYAELIRAMPREQNWIGGVEGSLSSAQCRAQAEAGTLALSQGDYLQAAELFFAAGPEYLTDLSYIAERVLSTPELVSFVDQRTKPQTLKNVAAEGEPAQYSFPYDEQSYQPMPGVEQHTLRSVLARRLMREGAYQQALPYFNDPSFQAAAKEYGQARTLAESSSGIAKAEALYAAAKLARLQGIDILGFELAPDYASYGGSYAPWSPLDEPAESPEAQSAQANFVKSRDAFVTELEKQRLAQSLAKPNKRFHYRFVATDLAGQAADAVPARSQAFAAVLCHATSWVINRDAPEAQKIYARYVKEGPYVPWGGIFGTSQACPEPDFVGAQALMDKQTTAARKRMIRKALPFAAAGFGALVLIGGLMFWRSRAKKGQRP